MDRNILSSSLLEKINTDKESFLSDVCKKFPFFAFCFIIVLIANKREGLLEKVKQFFPRLRMMGCRMDTTGMEG